MEFVVITGFSGAGKSIAIDALEDIGYYCIDNIPPALIGSFASLCFDSGKIDKAAIVTDTRGGDFFDGLSNALEKMKKNGINYKMLFLEASNDVLVKRYKETRRRHPLLEEADNSIAKAVETERRLLAPIRDKSDFKIDTSLLSAKQLKERIAELFLENLSMGLNIHCMSFGFKYGPATEADLMFDVRCLPNPYYIDDLRPKTGLDREVSDYVLSFENAQIMLKKLLDLIDFLIPLYQKEGKSQIVIAIGCTGGKHRSVTFAEQIYKHLNEAERSVTVSHRDIHKR